MLLVTETNMYCEPWPVGENDHVAQMKRDRARKHDDGSTAGPRVEKSCEAILLGSSLPEAITSEVCVEEGVTLGSPKKLNWQQYKHR